MANEKNLKQNSERTPKERQELARKAGKASGKARRERKTLRELLNSQFDEVIEYKGEKMSRKAVMTARAAELLSDPDTVEGLSVQEFVRLFEMARDTMGEKSSEKIEVATADQAKFAEFLDYIEQDHGSEREA